MGPILVMRGFYRIDYLVSIAHCTGEIPCMWRLCRVQPQLTRRSAVSLPSSVRKNKSPYRSVTRGRRDGEKRRPLLTATTLGSFEAVGRKYANKGPSHGVCRAKSLLHFSGRTRYIGDMLWRTSRGRPLNAAAAFI